MAVSLDSNPRSNEYTHELYFTTNICKLQNQRSDGRSKRRLSIGHLGQAGDNEPLPGTIHAVPGQTPCNYVMTS